MEKDIFRLLSLELDGIKNVEHGVLSFKDSVKQAKEMIPNFPLGEVMGIYGPNGSGKTAAIESLYLLSALAHDVALNKKKRLMSSLPCCYANQSKIAYRFYLSLSDGYQGIIETTLCFSKPSTNSQAIDILSERISWKILQHGESFNGLNTKGLYVDYQSEDPSLSEDILLRPAALYGRPSDSRMRKTAKLISLKEQARQQGQFLLLSEDFADYLESLENEDARQTASFLRSFVNLLQTRLFVYTTEEDALTNLGRGALHAVAHDRTATRNYSGRFMFRTDGPFDIAEEERPHYDDILAQINYLVPAFVPGFKAEIIQLDTHVVEGQLDENGQPRKAQSIEIVRVLDNGVVPMSFESAGIRKFVSIASVLIQVYNDPTIILAIDEFDSGVYEYLLGQIIMALKENAKGQLVFTCHNLRPVELLHGEGVYFTTTNPKERYLQFKGLKGNNNARTSYFRALELGGQKESLYDETFVSEIERALRRGGKTSHA